MSILKAIAARLFTRRKSDLIVVHEKKWLSSHLFLLYKIIVDKVFFCVYYLCEWSFYHENKDFVRFNRRGN